MAIGARSQVSCVCTYEEGDIWGGGGLNATISQEKLLNTVVRKCYVET